MSFLTNLFAGVCTNISLTIIINNVNPENLHRFCYVLQLVFNTGQRLHVPCMPIRKTDIKS